MLSALTSSMIKVLQRLALKYILAVFTMIVYNSGLKYSDR